MQNKLDTVDMSLQKQNKEVLHWCQMVGPKRMEISVGIATRYAKNSSSLLAAVHIRCFAIWVNILA